MAVEEPADGLKWVMDKVTVLYNRSEYVLVRHALADNRRWIAEALVGEWKESCWEKK